MRLKKFIEKLKVLIMKTLLILSALVAVAFANKHQFHNHHTKEDHNPKDEEHPHHHEMKCRGDPIVKDKEFQKSKHECKKEIKKEDDESEGHKHGRACIAVCALQKVGALDVKGFPVEDKLKTMIHSTIVNQDARLEIDGEIKACGKNATDLGTASSDNKCSNYKPYLDCMWESIVAACVDPFEHQDEE